MKRKTKPSRGLDYLCWLETLMRKIAEQPVPATFTEAIASVRTVVQRERDEVSVTKALFRTAKQSRCGLP